MMSGGYKKFSESTFLVAFFSLIFAQELYASPGPAAWNFNDYNVYISTTYEGSFRSLLFISKKNYVMISSGDGIPLAYDKNASFILNAQDDGSFSIVEQNSNFPLSPSSWLPYSPQVIHADFNNDFKDDLYLN